MTASEADVEAAIRVGCTAADIHLRCSYPSCACKQIPAAIKAAIAADPGRKRMEDALTALLDAVPEPIDYLDDAPGLRLCRAVNAAREVLFDALVARAALGKEEDTNG